MNVLVSACLLGLPCKYNGGTNTNAALVRAAGEGRVHLVPVCPECYGGLPTPRSPSELREGRVYAKEGDDRTEQFTRGAESALAVARMYGCRCAVLKEKSPSCGCGRIYDGSFSGTLVEGDGLTAALLKKNGLTVWGESRAEEFLRWAETQE